MEVFNVEDVTANDVIQKNIAKEKKRNLLKDVKRKRC